MDILKQNYIRYALIMTGLIIACLAYMHLSGQFNNLSSKSPELIVMMFVPLLVWFFGIRSKKNQLGGFLTFKEGFTEGFKISLAYAILSPFIFLGYYTLINIGILEYVAREYGLVNASRETVIVVDMFVQFAGSLIVGTLYGAIASFILKTK